MSEFGILETGFKIKTFIDIIDSIQSSYRVRLEDNKYILDFNTPEGIHSEAISYEIKELWEQCLELSNNMSIDTASGVFLDFFGILLGIPRKSGTYSKGQVNIIGSQNLVVPRNTIISYAGLDYFLTENVVLDEFDGSVYHNIGFIQAMGLGADYNLNKDVEFSYTYNGISKIINNVDITDGTNEELDDSYRERLKSNKNITNTATYKAIENGLNALESVNDVMILDPETIPSTQNGTIKIFIDGTPSDEIYQAIVDYKADGVLTLGDTSAEIFTKNITVGKRERTITYNVIKFKSPRIKVEVNEVLGTLDSRYTDSIKAEIIKYINSLVAGESIYYNKIYSEVLGIDDIRKIKLYIAINDGDTLIQYPFDTEFSVEIGLKYKINNDNIEVVYVQE